MACALVAQLIGCASVSIPKGVVESFDATDRFSRVVARAPLQACGAARMALLSQGYVVTTANDRELRARKDFQSIGASHAQMNIHVVCTEGRNRSDPHQAIVFASALQERYELKQVNTEASLGVGGLGSISLPWSTSNESLVKVSSETLSSPRFYDRFFEVLERYVSTPSRLPSESPGTTLDEAMGPR